MFVEAIQSDVLPSPPGVKESLNDHFETAVIASFYDDRESAAVFPHLDVFEGFIAHKAQPFVAELPKLSASFVCHLAEQFTSAHKR